MKAYPSGGPVSPHIAYLLRMYPRFSQTFIVNEILELERQRLRITLLSLRAPTDGVFHESISRVRARAHYAPESLVSGGDRLRSAQWSCIRARPYRYVRGLTRVMTSSRANLIDLTQAAYLRGWVRKLRVDHVHVHFGTQEATVAYLANVLGGLSYSLTLHAFDIFRDGIDRALLARKINASRFTVTVSRFNRHYLLDHVPGIDPAKVRVNYNGVDLQRFQPSPTPREPDLIFDVGRLIEKKGFIHLIRAVGLLRDEGLSLRCIIAGEGREQNRLRSEIKRLRLTDRVKLVGALEQSGVSDLLRRSSCFVLPCIRANDGNMDALPTVLLESLASGCPSISTRISGVPEIIEDGVSGLLVEPEDDRALAKAIRVVLDDLVRARRFGEVGRRRAVETFDIRKNAADMRSWLLAAAKGGAAASGLRASRQEPAPAQVRVPVASGA